MAKVSSVQKNLRRKRIVENKKETRAALKAIVMNKNLPFEERIVATQRLNGMPRDSSEIRVRNRCGITGRPRGYYRKFNMSRIALREFGSNAAIPGLTKAIW